MFVHSARSPIHRTRTKERPSVTIVGDLDRPCGGSHDFGGVAARGRPRSLKRRRLRRALSIFASSIRSSITVVYKRGVVTINFVDVESGRYLALTALLYYVGDDKADARFWRARCKKIVRRLSPTGRFESDTRRQTGAHESRSRRNKKETRLRPLSSPPRPSPRRV